MIERLSISDWPEFEELFKKQFESEPPKLTDAIVVVEKLDGKITSFGVVRTYIVLESFWVAPERIGTLAVAKMGAKILDIIPRLRCCFAFTTDERLVKLFGYMGMEHLKECKVLRWLRS